MDNPRPTRRRWFQFGTGTMLLVVTVFAIGIGYIGWAERWAMDREAFLKEVTEYEGSRNVHYGQPGTVAPWRLGL